MALTSAPTRVWFLGRWPASASMLAASSLGSLGVNFYGSSGTARTAANVAAGSDGFDFATAVSASTFYAAVGAIDNTGQGYTIQSGLPAGWTMPSVYSLFVATSVGPIKHRALERHCGVCRKAMCGNAL
jgi:hypothetical protein